MILRDIFQGQAAPKNDGLSSLTEKNEEPEKYVSKTVINDAIRNNVVAAPENILLTLDIPSLEIDDYDIVLTKEDKVTGSPYNKDAVEVIYKIFRPLDEVDGRVSFTFSYTSGTKDLVDINIQVKIQVELNGKKEPNFFFWLNHKIEPKKIWEALLQRTESLIKSAIIDDRKSKTLSTQTGK